MLIFTMTKLKEQFVYDTALVCVQHLKNALKYRKESGDGGGIHSRLMEDLLHPEEHFILCGQSQEVIDGKPSRKEHVVPCVVLVDKTLRLLNAGKDIEYIAKLFAKHWKVARISKDEARFIDSKKGANLKKRMPEGWCFEKGDTLARLKAAGIQLHPVN